MRGNDQVFTIGNFGWILAIFRRPLSLSLSQLAKKIVFKSAFFCLARRRLLKPLAATLDLSARPPELDFCLIGGMHVTE